MYTHIRELFKQTKKYISQTVTVGGWVRTSRDNKNFGFIEINDGSFFKTVQVVIDASLTQGEQGLSFEQAVKLNVGACVTVTGVVVESPGAKQAFEIKASSVILEGACEPDFPLQKKRHTLEYLRTMAHLRPRTNTFNAVFRVRSLIAFAIHQFFRDRNFVYVHTPLITASDTEGAGEMFQVTTLNIDKLPRDGSPVDYGKDFFGKWAGLTVSGQLNVEAFAMAFRDVYTFGPTFRAENSNTTTHAAEFWMIEPEICFADLDNAMQLAEDMLKYIIVYLLEEAPEEMEFFNAHIDNGLIERLQNIAASEFIRLPYGEAVEILKKSGQKFEFPVEWGEALQTEHERYLTEQVFKKPVFVRDYPRAFKAFYMRVNDDGRTVAASDMLVPGIGELIGMSQREERIDMLMDQMRFHNIKPEDYEPYVDLRKYGGVKHAGYGLGFERCVMYLTGMKNIRDVIPYPRTPKNLAF
jgi:asparaginyl-tRNA synthetase